MSEPGNTEQNWLDAHARWWQETLEQWSLGDDSADLKDNLLSAVLPQMQQACQSYVDFAASLSGNGDLHNLNTSEHFNKIRDEFSESLQNHPLVAEIPQFKKLVQSVIENSSAEGSLWLELCKPAEGEMPAPTDCLLKIMSHFFSEHLDTKGTIEGFSQSIQQFHEAQNQLQIGLLRTVESALEELLETLKSDSGESENPETLKLRQIYNLWVDLAESNYLKHVRGAGFQGDLAELMNSACKVQNEWNQVVQPLGKLLNLPSRQEIDDLYLRQRDLMRENRALRRELKQLKLQGDRPE